MLHCPYCKGLHSSKNCPFYLKALAITNIKKSIINENFQSNSPAPFVGQYGYPSVRVGLLTPPQRKDDAWAYDAPKFWANNSFQIPQIVDFRTALVNSQETANIKQQNKIVELGQFVAMANKPVELEILLKEKPNLRLNLDPNSAPTGTNAKLKKARITANPSIPTKVDKVFADTDFKAADAIIYLHKHGFDENFLTKLLSVGTLGIKANRKLVPTKWSITATDDLLGKNMIEQIKDFSVANFESFFGGYLGNYYFFLFFPAPWSYELFEIYLPAYQKAGTLDYSTDHEFFGGRKQYAFDTAGGYYTVRLAILEKLSELKRQAAVVAIRIITEEYSLPLGVWVTREASRKTVANKSIVFSDEKLLTQYAAIFLNKKFGLSIERILKESKILNLIKKQKKLNTFFST